MHCWNVWQRPNSVNLAKCEFARATVTYLGKVVGMGKMRPVDAKVIAIDTFPDPQTKHERMRFLGMAGYYRSFCPNCSSVVAPLTDLLQARAKFVWSPTCENKPFKLQVDASQVGTGAVLLQTDEHGIDRPISYFSRKFNSYQTNYSTIEKEALIWALQHFEVIVSCGIMPTVVYTDHNPITFLHSLQSPNHHLIRWSLFLQPYYLEICHLKGVDNVLADALSRAPCG